MRSERKQWTLSDKVCASRWLGWHQAGWSCVWNVKVCFHLLIHRVIVLMINRLVLISPSHRMNAERRFVQIRSNLHKNNNNKHKQQQHNINLNSTQESEPSRGFIYRHTWRRSGKPLPLSKSISPLNRFSRLTNCSSCWVKVWKIQNDCKAASKRAIFLNYYITTLEWTQQCEPKCISLFIYWHNNVMSLEGIRKKGAFLLARCYFQPLCWLGVFMTGNNVQRWQRVMLLLHT